VLRERAMSIARNSVGAALWKALAPAVDKSLDSIAKGPGRHMPLPRCKKQAIPIAIDDGQVYRLDVKVDGGSGRVAAASVRFSLEPGVTRTFSLRDLDRIDAMLARGFARGTITRKPGGGLLLHLPFEKECTTGSFPGNTVSGSKGQPGHVVVAGVDLGLKHLAWQSIGKCKRTARGDGSWEPVDEKNPEIARYCIDQPQIAGRKDAWLKGALPSHVPNFVARREWQRCWRKVRHMHEEVARQVATRIVAACVHHVVGMLRFEDLSWSSHSAKRETGAWLASWQVHWFFSEVQERATRLARLAGIAV
jgi:hypothetical protein